MCAKQLCILKPNYLNAQLYISGFSFGIKESYLEAFACVSDNNFKFLIVSVSVLLFNFSSRLIKLSKILLMSHLGNDLWVRS